MLCTEWTSELNEYAELNTIWVAVLNDGNKVYCSDGINHINSWAELYDYCTENNKYVTSLYLKNRSNIHRFPDNCDAYCVNRMVRGWLGEDKHLEFFVVGYEENGIMKVRRIQIPELLYDSEETRSPNDLRYVIRKI